MTYDVIIKNFFPLFFKMAESFENLENNLPDWANEDVKKSLSEAVDRYVKQEEERKTRFFVENDFEKILEQSQSRATKQAFFVYLVSLIYKTNIFHVAVRLFSIGINLLAFYHECRSLIGYATRYLFCDR